MTTDAPYGGIPVIPDVGKIDANKVGSVYGIPNKNGPDYIPYNPRGRDIFGRLSFNTGVMWLGGFLAGGGLGFVEGWRNAASPNYKIKFNSVMNGFSKRGSKLGNGLGVIAFIHTTSIWVADSIDVERTFGNDAATPLFAGLLTGALYKSTRGPRAAALAGGIGMVISSAYWYGGSYFYNVILRKGGRF